MARRRRPGCLIRPEFQHDSLPRWDSPRGICQSESVPSGVMRVPKQVTASDSWTPTMPSMVDRRRKYNDPQGSICNPQDIQCFDPGPHSPSALSRRTMYIHPYDSYTDGTSTGPFRVAILEEAHGHANEGASKRPDVSCIPRPGNGRRAFNRQSTGYQRAIHRQSTGNQQAFNRYSTGNQQAINRQSTGNRWAIIGQWAMGQVASGARGPFRASAQDGQRRTETVSSDFALPGLPDDLCVLARNSRGIEFRAFDYLASFLGSKVSGRITVGHGITAMHRGNQGKLPAWGTIWSLKQRVGSRE